MKIPRSVSLEPEDWDFFDNQAKLADMTTNAFFKKMIDDLRAGNQTQAQATIEEELKQAKLDVLKATKRIKEAEATVREMYLGKVYAHNETFGKPPSKEALKAIQQNVSEKTPPPPPPPEKKINVLLYAQSITRNDIDQYVVICDFCRSDFIDFDRSKALVEFEAHLKQHHREQIYK